MTMVVSPIELAIFQSSVHSIAEEMGAALRRTAISPNIKERRDYSCALFDRKQRVIAMGDHMPVHLGSMQMSVEAAVARLVLKDGDMAILNDPYAGGRICRILRWCFQSLWMGRVWRKLRIMRRCERIMRM
jgi:N-methylhydantoinase B